MDSNTVRKRLMSKLSVPSLPDVVSQTLSLLNSDAAGARQVGEMVAKDPPLTVRLLRIANSALYSPQAPILSPEHAAAVLGFDSLRNLLLRASVVDLFAHLDRFPGLDLADLWKDSRVCARIARDLPGSWQAKLKREDAYLCGLLHNIGQFVLLDQLGAEYVEVLQRYRTTGKTLRALELSAFQLSHDQVGFLVARRWQLPRVLLESLRYHLDSTGHVERNHGVAVTHVARVVTSMLRAGDESPPSERIRPKVLQFLGLEPRALDIFAEDTLRMLPSYES